MIGGDDTYVEDLYLLIVDLPGQGGLPFDGLYMRPDSENLIPAVVDYALKRTEVDDAGLAAYGISYGGYMLPRALSAERRIRDAAVRANRNPESRLITVGASDGGDVHAMAQISA